FITTWQTTAENETVTIPTVSGETYNYTVKWGDGSANTTHTNATPPSHMYATANTYTITISGTFPRIRFGETNFSGGFVATTAAGQIRSVKQWGDIQWASMNNAFTGCDNLTFNATDVPNLSNVTNMSYMFVGASFNGDLSKWDVSKVTNMAAMFYRASFNQDISEWDVSKVTDMTWMFRGSSFNQDISEWNVSSVTSMHRMFAFLTIISISSGAIEIIPNSFNGDLSKWDISSVKNMSFMFNGNTSMSSENYDKLLIGWSTLDKQSGETRIPPNISFGAPDHYSCAGEAARNKLIKDYSWSIAEDSKRADAIDPTPNAMTLKALTACAQITENELNNAAPAATDNCPGATVRVSHDVNTFPITSNITITWTFTDEANNTAEQTQTVTIGDSEAPEVTGTLPEVTSQCPINAENELTEPAAPADNCKGPVSVALKTGTPFPIQAGTTTLTWVYTDEADNTSEQTQDVTIADTESPTVTDLNAITAACSLAEDDLPEPTATDNCDEGQIMGAHNVTNFPITSNTTITWTYTDKADNTAMQTQQVIVDNTPPTVTGNLNAITAQCRVTEAEVNAAVPAAGSDTCPGEVTVTHNIPADAFPITADRTITWTHTDAAGNTATQTQDVDIDDTEAPRVTGTLNAITAQCPINAENELTKPAAPSDNCGGTVNVALKTGTSFPIQAGITTITWVYTDESDNTSEQTQKVTIDDTEAPRGTGTLNAITAACSLAEADLPVPTATDNCDGTLTAETSAADDALEAVVFPNPSGRYVEVQSPVESPIRVLSLGGELVLKSTTNTKIDAASLHSGLYLIQLPDGRLLKFVKR
ncbi:MAG: BspA family leucine-rich repeat surface protein, partial [Ekhidna sp.]|nr:BspA family leucine-rich repeat surface protein [Ekhidna sp.]